LDKGGASWKNDKHARYDEFGMLSTLATNPTLIAKNEYRRTRGFAMEEQELAYSKRPLI